MSYVLESRKEFDRLEKQSQTDLYDFRRELSYFPLPQKGKILDAGCGSGIVARYIASICPDAQVMGCDQSSERVEQAKKSAQNISNLTFQKESIKKLSFKDHAWDAIVCRFVLEHLDETGVKTAVSELFRCTKPGGQVCLIDIDGYLFNIFPQTPTISKFLKQLVLKRPADLQIGRKLPSLMVEAGFEHVSWKIETMQCTGSALTQEKELLTERMEHTLPTVQSLLGSKKKAIQFRDEYLGLLEREGTSLFYNKFIVLGYKPSLKLVRS